MATDNPYLVAAGLDNYEQAVATDLSFDGALLWTARKAPAIAGGLLAQTAYDWAVKKWPDSKRGPQFVGSAAVLIVSFGLEVAATRYMPENSKLFETLTAGMLGRVAPVVWKLLKGFVGMDGDGKESKKAAQGWEDQESLQDAALLFANSPEVLNFMGSRMFELMSRDGVQINDEGRAAIVRSMGQVAHQMANGNFGFLRAA